MKTADASRSWDLVIIALAFFAWKALLGIVVSSSPGIGYDTSSSLLEDFGTSLELTETASTLHHVSTKLVRWDAIYFTQAALRGYVFEQEWAFSYTFSKIVAIISEGTFMLSAQRSLLTSAVIRSCVSLHELQAVAISGILLSDLAHLCSVYVLYFLCRGVYIRAAHVQDVALCAALLHVISPAGMFLSSPYTESLFSFLNFSGLALYLRGMSRVRGHATMPQRLEIVAAGLIFGVATAIRSNGLLSGLPFLYDAIARTWAIAIHGLSGRRLYDLASLVIGGLLISLGLIIPQMIAYHMYCIDSIAGARQPWCTRTIPSIYAWVQEHYW